MFGPGRTNLSDGYTYSEYDCDFSRSIIDKGTPVSDGDTHGAVVYLLIICCIAAVGAAAKWLKTKYDRQQASRSAEVPLRGETPYVRVYYDGVLRQ